MSKDSLRIAVHQMSASENPDANLRRIFDAMQKAKAGGSDILIVPELAVTGYGRGEVLRDLAMARDGEQIRELEAAAKDTGIALVAGFPERDGEEYYISAVVIGSDDASTMIYRKAFLYGEYEKTKFTPAGPSVLLTEFKGVKTGFLICYDVEFPENVRRLAQAGAELVLIPTALPKGNEGYHIANRVLPVRAFENQVFIAYANHADQDENFTYQGTSSIVAPDGTFLAKADETGHALITADIDPTNYGESRKRNPYLDDLRCLENS